MVFEPRDLSCRRVVFDDVLCASGLRAVGVLLEIRCLTNDMTSICYDVLRALQNLAVCATLWF